MHEAIATVSPATALKVGLKVDVEALPPEVTAALRADQVNLDDPSVTATLVAAGRMGEHHARRRHHRFVVAGTRRRDQG